MADQWIPAATARALVAGDSKSSFGVIEAICTRAYHGILAARCALFTFEKQQRENSDVPPKFWWAKGEAALDQNWKIGDFSTWIDGKYECRAFGVTFSLEGLLTMIPAERRGPARRAVSVHGSPEWISAIEARRFIEERTGLSANAAELILLQHANFGFVPARAVSMFASPAVGGDTVDHQREWDIPDGFWASLNAGSDWQLGAFSSRIALGEACEVTALEVHFAKAALDLAFSAESAIGIPSSTTPIVEATGGPKGRPPAAYWDELWCAIWGDIFLGDLKLVTQADAQTAMLNWLEAHGHTASESTIKPRARRLILELKRVDKKSALT